MEWDSDKIRDRQVFMTILNKVIYLDILYVRNLLSSWFTWLRCYPAVQYEVLIFYTFVFKYLIEVPTYKE